MPVRDPHWIAKKTPGAGLKDYERQINMPRLRQYRMDRLRAELQAADYGACLLYDPINIRYATGTRNMQVYGMHTSERYAMVMADGPTIIFDSYMVKHPVTDAETVDQYLPTIVWYYEVMGDRVGDEVLRWAAQIADIMDQHCGKNRRLAIDRLEPLGYAPLMAQGIEICDAQPCLQRARAVKSQDEIDCMLISIAGCEAGMARMREALRPGVTENYLWSLLAQANFELGGEWMETRLLCSGGRTNPWYQECSEKLVRCGDLVAFDTDLVGAFGYCADVSRTFHCGPGKPTDEQRRLYTQAYQQVQHNISILRPGMGFRDFIEQSWTVPDAFLANRYIYLAHGVGLADEYPCIPHILDWESAGYPGEILENMVLCIESYIGREGGAEGVKLEEQVLVTADGPQILTTFPFEEDLLA